MRITFIGDSSCIPDVGREMASFLINGKHLVDTGWCAALTMRKYGLDPLAIESILITHFHQDHYLGLPQALFFIGLRKGGAPLKIIGPSEHVEHIVKAAEEFLQIPRFPELKVDRTLVPIAPGDRFEMEDVRLETCAAKHMSGHNRAEQALVYKVTEKAGGTSFVFTGDTHYHPPIADFAKGVPLLIHDGAHTSARDAATIAKTAGVGRLVLIHYLQSHGPRLLEEARAVFPNTELAVAGETITC